MKKMRGKFSFLPPGTQKSALFYAHLRFITHSLSTTYCEICKTNTCRMELLPLKIRFCPKIKSGSLDRYCLHMRMVMAKQRTEISLHYDLMKEAWDSNQQMLKNKHRDRGYVLNLTNHYRKKALDVYQQLIQRGASCDANLIRQQFTEIDH